MIKKIAILGSTGSIGTKTLEIIKRNKNKFKIILLTTNTNVKKIMKQSKEFNVKTVLVSNYSAFIKAKKKYKKKNINILNSFSSLKKILLKEKLYYTMVSLVGLDGLDPILKMIKYSENIAIVNKEPLLCGWNLIKKQLNKYKTNFIPVDSEHFSILELLRGSKIKDVEKIFITASGGPFLNYKKSMLSKVTLNDALNHPRWKMGKKISIDSATMMNKVFEVIEAKNIFNIDYDKISILLHPKSYVHSIIKFNNGQIKILAHETDMGIPIFNSLKSDNLKNMPTKKINLDILNDLNFKMINEKKFPTTKILNKLPKNNTLYETAIVSINDFFVEMFLNKKINFKKLINLICKHVTNRDIIKFKKIPVTNIDEINKTREYVISKLSNIMI